MEFLVRIEVSLPPDMPMEQREELLAAELACGKHLVRRGVIRRIWRIPGGLRNVGIWESPDATHLHEAISTLPLFAWMQADVLALAQHPLDKAER
jgi:muconolactone D-isomerase